LAKVFIVGCSFSFVAALIGCEPKRNAEQLSVEVQIEEYLSEVELGRELFRADSLIPGNSYQVPFLSAVFRDTVISHTRSFDYSVPRTILYFPVDARGILSVQVLVRDEFVVRSIGLRTGLPDTVITTMRTLLRDGWFLKAGSSSDVGYGWILWGFNGTVSTSSVSSPMPVDIQCETEDSSIFSGDSDMLEEHFEDTGRFSFGEYILIEDIRNIPQGERLYFRGTPANASSATRYVTGLSARDEFGIEKSIMTRITNADYRDTIKTQNPNNKLWNLVYVEAFRDDQFFFIKSWVIPYRVPQ
jgi:hypothetical protein